MFQDPWARLNNVVVYYSLDRKYQKEPYLNMYFLDYKELIKNLVISDLKTKYSSSVLGFAWSMLNPLMMMLVLYFVFSNVFKIPREILTLSVVISALIRGIAPAQASLFVYYMDMNRIWYVYLKLGFFRSSIVYLLSLIPEKDLFYYNYQINESENQIYIFG